MQSYKHICHICHQKAVFATLPTVRFTHRSLNLLTPACVFPQVVSVTMQATKHEQQQPPAQQPKYNSGQHALPDGSSADLLGVPQDSSRQTTDRVGRLLLTAAAVD